MDTLLSDSQLQTIVNVAVYGPLVLLGIWFGLMVKANPRSTKLWWSFAAASFVSIAILIAYAANIADPAASKTAFQIGAWAYVGTMIMVVGLIDIGVLHLVVGIVNLAVFIGRGCRRAT